MSHRSAKGTKRNTRSKSCGRLSIREPSTALPNSKQLRSAGHSSLSPTETNVLPATFVNNSSSEQKGKQQNNATPPTVSSQFTTSSEELLSELNVGPPLPLKTLAKRTLSLRSHDQGDNKVNSSTGSESGSPKSNMGTKVHQGMSSKAEQSINLILDELKDIKTQINRIEANTSSLAEQLLAVVDRTTKVESEVATNASQIKEAKKELTALKASVDKHESCLSEVAKIKEDFQEMTDHARDQINDTIGENASQIKADIMIEVNKQVDKIRQESRCQTLKDQAFNTRHNLVITGLAEDKDKNTLTLAQEFITQTLSIKNVTINTAHRIGIQPEEGGKYARPIIIKFNNIVHRNIVWKNRIDITREDCDKKIRIQADLPKALRTGVQNLYKVAKAASKIKEYESAMVRDYQLELNGEVYQITELEKLPKQLRPSTLSAPTSDTTMVFFSQNSLLSNHYPSSFNIDGHVFRSIEQYLALQRAVLAENKPLIKRARKAHDPLQAKYILNSLKGSHQEEWDGMVEELTLEGLRAKFSQNESLRDYLCSTSPLVLGEASKNPVWGIGMDLNDEEVLNQSKWKKGGNLLGRCLMEIREEFLSEPANPTSSN